MRLDYGSPFEEYNNSILLREAEDDNADQKQEENTANDQAEEIAPAENTDNNADAGGADEDFDIDANDDLGDDTGDGNEDTGGDNSATDNADGSEAGVDTAAKKRDREIFESLSPEEQKLKLVKLKELYMKLYARCEQIIEKYDSLGVKYEDLVIPIKNSVNALYSLKDTISSYLLYLFDSKSYIENDIMFNRFLVAMNQIKLITKDMRDSHKEEIEAVKSNTPLNDKDIEKEKSTPNINKD